MPPPGRRASSSSHGPRGARLPRRARVLGVQARRRGPRHPLHAQGRAVRADARARSRRGRRTRPAVSTGSTRASRRRGARAVFVAHRADPLDGDGDDDGDGAATVTRLRLLPEVFFAFSAAPKKPAGARRTPTGWTTRSSRATPELPVAPKDASSDAASDAVSASRRADAKKRLRSFLFTRALEEARPSATCEPGANCTWARATPSERAASGVAWRRGGHRAAAEGARRDDEARAATATADGRGSRASLLRTRASAPNRTTRVWLRYDARTARRRERDGGDGGAAPRPRRSSTPTSRKPESRAPGGRARRGALVAMHRAGGDGEDGEG